MNSTAAPRTQFTALPCTGLTFPNAFALVDGG